MNSPPQIVPSGAIAGAVPGNSQHAAIEPMVLQHPGGNMCMMMLHAKCSDRLFHCPTAWRSTQDACHEQAAPGEIDTVFDVTEMGQKSLAG